MQAVLYGPAGQGAVQVRVSWALPDTRAGGFSCTVDVWKQVGLVDFFVVGGGRVS